MKKILLTFVGLLTWTLAVHAADPKLISVSWDLNGDSTTTCPEYINQQALCNGDTLWQDSIGYLYQGYKDKGLELATGKNLGYGPYYHVSKDNEANAICLLVPGHSDAEIVMNNRIGSKQQYTFYLFALPVGEKIPADLLTQKAQALDSAKWKMSDYTEGTVTLKANMAKYPDDQYQLAIIFINDETKGMRHRGITYTQTKVYPKPVETIVLDSIVVTDPQTLTFTIGDTYEFGGKVTAYYSDSTTVDVTKKAVFSNTEFTTAGKQNIQISFTDSLTKETSYEVTVVEVDPTQLNSASWNVHGDATATCIGYWYQEKIGALDTLVKNNVAFYYIQGSRIYEPNTKGAYWHNSNSTKLDNVLALTVRAGVKSEIELTLLPGADKEYHFYAFTQDASLAKPAALYDSIAVAVDSVELTGANPAASATIKLKVDITSQKVDQNIFIIYTGTTGLRHQAITYTETEFAQPTAIIEKEVTNMVRKMIVNGQMVIIRDGKQYNALGAQL